MKKRSLIIAGILFIFGGLLSACAAPGSEGSSSVPAPEVKEEAAPSAEEAPEETEEAAEEEEEGFVGMANPWVDITEDEAEKMIPRLFKAPEGAEVLGWMNCEDLADPDKGIGPMVQLSFMLDGLSYTARAQMGAGDDTDIGGNYVEWTYGPEEVTLNNWGGATGKLRRAVNDSGYVDEITWNDVEIGTLFCLSVAAEDLDGFDITAIVEAMYEPENEPKGDYGPEDFLQEQSGRTSFGSFDEVKAALKKGQGYAFIKLKGSDEDILAVTDLVFESDHSAAEASLYGTVNGKLKHLGIVTGNGSAYPLRLSDGILYAGDNHTYATYFLSASDGALMYKDSIEDGVNYGTEEFSGFMREDNSFDSVDFTGGQEEFDALLSEREKKPVIEFTALDGEE